MRYSYQQIKRRLDELLRAPATDSAPDPVRERWEMDVEVYRAILLRLEMEGSKTKEIPE